MGIYRAHIHKRLHGVTFALALPFVALGYFVDVFANITIASVVFLELPKEWLVTHRLKRYIKAEEGLRYKVSKWICDKMLDTFDPTGDHC